MSPQGSAPSCVTSHSKVQCIPHLEQQSVAGADGQAGNLGQRVGARLKDDEHHADGAGHLRSSQVQNESAPASQQCQRLDIGGDVRC